MALAAVLAGFLYFAPEAPDNAPKKLACSADSGCAIKITDCTCGGPIYSCVSADYPVLECRNESFTCPKKENPKPDSCACQNNLCTATSCAGLCADWKKEGYANVLKNVELLVEANCCSGIEDCTDRCAGGQAFTEDDLDCTDISSPQEYARQRCKGYVSNNSISEASIPLALKRDARTYLLSCSYAGESVLGEYAFSYKGRFCALNPAGMGFLYAPVSAEEALDYYLFSAHNISQKKEERNYELIPDFPAFISNRSTCNITYPPANRTGIEKTAGGFNLSVLEYLPSKRQAVYTQAIVYRSGNIEKAGTIVVSAC